jgi:hypothetical protein
MGELVSSLEKHILRMTNVTGNKWRIRDLIKDAQTVVNTRQPVNYIADATSFLQRVDPLLKSIQKHWEDHDTMTFSTPRTFHQQVFEVMGALLERRVAVAHVVDKELEDFNKLGKDGVKAAVAGAGLGEDEERDLKILIDILDDVRKVTNMPWILS